MTEPAFTSRGRSRRSILRLGAAAGGVALAGRLLPRGTALARPYRMTGAPASPLPPAITAVMQKTRYKNATWNLLVADLATGEVLLEQQPDDLILTGSVRKLFS